MSCTLSKFKTYDVGAVRHDKSTGAYTVNVLNAGSGCPEGVFVSKKAELVVDAKASPHLGFNLQEGKPVISVPSEAFVIDYGSSGIGFADILMIGGGAFLAYLLGRYVYRQVVAANLAEHTLATVSRPSSYSSFGSTSSYPPSSGAPIVSGSQPSTTVINNSSSPDLLTTLLVADALSSHDHGHSGGGGNVTNNYYGDPSSSDSTDDLSSSTFSSDSDESSSSGDSFSSDSSSDDSFSSDSSSDDSFSSDSSSSDSFSSDSGDSGGFSSDS